MDSNLENIIQEIDYYFKKKQYKQALALCTDEICKYDLYIQSRKIKCLIKLKKYQEALKECKEEYCKKNLAIQSQKITILMKLRKYQEALEECNKEYCEKNLIIQSQKITILIELGRYQEALKECNKEFCSNDLIIQSQKKLLMELDTNFYFISTSNNQNIYLTKLYFDDLTLEEIEVANISAFEKMILKIAFYSKYSKILGAQYMKTLKRNGTLSTEELKIVNKFYEKLMGKTIFDISICCQILDGSIDFSYVPNIKKEVKSQVILKKKEEQLPVKKEEKIIKQPRKMLVQEEKRRTHYDQNIYLTKLYFDDLTLEEIEAANISAFEKMILKIAFYNKYSKMAGTQYMKTLKRNGTLSTEELKIVNKFYEKLVGKAIFDISIYCQILDGSIDFSYVPNIKKEVNSQVILKKKEEQLPVKKEEKIKKQPRKMLVQEGKRRTRYDQNSNVENKTMKYEEQETLLKDLFAKDIEEIQKYIYLEMNNAEKQLRAIKAWDNFENIIYKKASDLNAYNYLLYIIEIFKKNSLIKSEELARKRVIKK